MAVVIEEAWRRGCRLDAWTEHFRFETWQRAMEAASIDLVPYAEKIFAPDSTLPWDAVDTGITMDYLWREYQKALSAEHTCDCRKQCHGCGLKCDPPSKAPKPPDSSRPLSFTIAQSGDDSVRVRMVYSKTGPARYLSHLELVTALLRSSRRAGFKFRYSAGYHPSPRVSFGPALGVGIAGSKEYLDMELEPPFEGETELRLLREQMPEGMHVHALVALSGRERSLNSFISRYTYEVQNASPKAVEAFMALKERIRDRTKGPVDIRKMVEEVMPHGKGVFHVTVCDTSEAHVRIDEVFPEIFGMPLQELTVTRIGMYGWDGRWREPVEGVFEWAAKS